MWYCRSASPLDAVFFAAYAFYAGFLLVALRRRTADRGVGSRLAVADAAILTLAMSSVLWVGVVEPNLTNGTPALATAVAVLYPGLQLLLFALAARLLLSLGARSRGAAALLCLWITGELAADVLYGVQSLNGTLRYDGPLVPVWMLAYTALAALAAHPGLMTLLRPTALPASAAPAARPQVSRLVRRRLRVGVLLGAALVPLGLAAFTHGQGLPLMAVAAVTFALGSTGPRCSPATSSSSSGWGWSSSRR